DRRFQWLTLAIPTVLLVIFTVLPLIFMVLMAFTNFDKAHQPPGNLFTWTGLDTFKDLFGGSARISSTFFNLLGWTLVWAFFATFTNYLFGILLALLINRRGIRFKGFWRTVFVMTIAVPQFVSLLLMSQLLSEQGAVNMLLQQLGLTDSALPFLTNATWARVTVILVNMWVGIPYTLLITTGILMNIPEELYESARIDGAGPAATFFRITLPYMLFVTAPYLITQFVGNVNNFNLIYLLTGGGPLSLDYYQAGKTDLLVTWLYKQTVNEQNYNLASAIGILVFLLSAVLSLAVYTRSAAAQREEEFQ
ncbi:MAG: sugar ABC transporter permease, partial [Clostridia bacterium]|nr:sugar ABC transporter permease [Clostridia bacterium]